LNDSGTITMMGAIRNRNTPAQNAKYRRRQMRSNVVACGGIAMAVS